MSGWRPHFAGSIRVDDVQSVVRLIGDLDIATAEQLRVLLDEAAQSAPATLVVDLAGVEFLDASGLTVLVGLSRRLERSGTRLVLRSASPRIYRLFRVTGLLSRLGVEPSTVRPALVHALADAAGLPVARTVLDAAMRLVVTMTHAVVKGADGASITLPRHGRLGTVAASNDVVLEMDHDQYDTGQGPCLDAATQGERLHIPSLDDEQRWPDFVPRARARGIRSVLSTPLVLANHPVGALNIYSRTPDAFASHEQDWADQFAAEAARVVVAAEPEVLTEPFDGRLLDALLSREVIGQAQGMVMQRDGVSADAAYTHLRQLSRTSDEPLRSVCERLVGAGGGPEQSPGGDRGLPGR